MDQTSPTPFPAYEKTSSSSRRMVVIIILILLLVGAGAGGVYYLNAKQSAPKDKTMALAPTPTTAPTMTPSPTPDSTTPSPSAKVTPKTSTTPAVSSSDSTKKGITISVLNGSGVSGAAKKAGDYLTGLGYTVSSTGNADADTYTTTSIQVKKSQSKILSTLKSDLAKQYTIGSTSATLSESSATDAIVTIGK